EARGRRAVLEDVAEVPAAARAHDLLAHHPVAAVLDGEHRAGLDGARVARPASTRVELVPRGEQHVSAAGAAVGALGFVRVQSAGKRALGALLPQLVELLRRELLLPLVHRFLDGEAVGAGLYALGLV